jgi:hypothetical protein
VSGRFVDALDAQGLGLVDGVGRLVRPSPFPVKFGLLMSGRLRASPVTGFEAAHVAARVMIRRHWFLY